MKLLLGVTGGIAAYKACELVSLATKSNWSVAVVMTKNATRFVGPTTFEGLTGQPVMVDTFARDGAMDHIDWPKWADVACLAPATANSLGKLANGIADDALSTTFLALRRGTPCVLAPAMNTEMWENPAVQRNMQWLGDQERYVVVPPVSKRLACGDVGVGGLAAPADILAAIHDALPT
ncbi:MAG: phosphopantothenoylcysteine decarboxylase [Proteobacteria bacterium]|nr:phosphopantothenoylcysteine decarboxylase [Pseudomonadota bacterium]MCP4918837.1 phosphopantothenoylcysteine decarboxylase [Pseudomonadota bacterium]